jgi:hypothetical protein
MSCLGSAVALEAGGLSAEMCRMYLAQAAIGQIVRFEIWLRKRSRFWMVR